MIVTDICLSASRDEQIRQRRIDYLSFLNFEPGNRDVKNFGVTCRLYLFPSAPPTGKAEAEAAENKSGGDGCLFNEPIYYK